MKRLLIVAPSAAGKSTLVRKFPSLLEDGDHIVRDTIGWPPGRWWETMNAEERQVFRVQRIQAICDWSVQHAEGNPRTILFNIDLAAMAGAWEERIAVWMPEEARHIANAQSRAASGNRSQPSDWASLLSMRLRMTATAAELGITVVHGDTIRLLQYITSFEQ